MVTTNYMGLQVWNLVTDPYDHAQLADNWAKVDQHDHSGNRGRQIPTGGIQDGAITAAKLDAGLTPTDDAGKSIIATSEVRTDTAYGKLATPDEVTIELPSDGLIKVLYQATWQESVTGAGRAAIFVGANQLFIQTDQNIAPTPLSQAARVTAGTPATDRMLASFPGGLASILSTNAFAVDVTTGQAIGVASTNAGGAASYELGSTAVSPPAPVVMGGPCYIFAPPGSHTISIQFKASSGSVTAKNRKLWVKAENYE